MKMNVHYFQTDRVDLHLHQSKFPIQDFKLMACIHGSDQTTFYHFIKVLVLIHYKF